MFFWIIFRMASSPEPPGKREQASTVRVGTAVVQRGKGRLHPDEASVWKPHDKGAAAAVQADPRGAVQVLGQVWGGWGVHHVPAPEGDQPIPQTADDHGEDDDGL